MDETDCPAPETLEGFLDGALPEPELVRVSSHIAECGICYREVAAAVQRRRDAPPPEHPLRPAFVTAIAFAIGLTVALWYLLGLIS